MPLTCQAAAGSAWAGVACGKALGRVVGLAGAQAVVQLAEHAVEQVPQRSGVTVAAVAAAQVVLPGWGGP